MDWLLDNWEEIIKIYFSIVAMASMIIKITPTLPAKHWALPLVKFIGSFIALNKSIDKRPK